MIGEKPSTVRYILKKGTTADRLTWYLPDKKRWEYFDLSPEFAVEETRRRNANKGPRGKVSNFFARDFAKAYEEKKSVTYALKALHEASPNADLPKRSTVYRLMDKGKLRDARGRPLTHRRYKKNRRKPASADLPRNHAPKHMVDDLPPAARHHTEPGHFQMDTEPGHFQMDTVHSSGDRGGILTLVDPHHGDPTAPRRFYMYALPTISQASVTSAFHRFRRDLRANGHELKTILTDNGSEFLHEDTLEALLHVPIYYCHPYSAWEKGSIERHRYRLLRLYHPKPTDFSKLSPRVLKQTHRLIVHYPRSPKKVS